MNDIENKLYLRETYKNRWPTVHPAGELRSVNAMLCSEWFGIEVVGADCVCLTVAMECCSPSKPGIGKDTFARRVEQHGPDVGKHPSVMT